MTVSGLSFGSAVSITRPTNTTNYSANQAVGPSTASAGAVLQFNNIGSPGQEIILTTVSLLYGATSVPSGMTSFSLALYSKTPPSALADGAAWTLASGDLPFFLGTVALGTPVALGSTSLYILTTQLNQQVTMPGLATGGFFAYLITAGSFTPGSGDVIKVTLHAVQP